MPRVGPALAVAAWALSVAWGTWRFNHIEAQLRDAPVVKIAQLQSSHGMEWRMSNPTSASWREWLQFTEQLQPREADIIVWPEGACPYDLQKGRARDRLAELARELDTELVIGGGTREREKDPEMGEFRVRQFNSVYFFERDGDVAGRYDKMVPLPFGEYFPLAETLPWLANMIEGPGDFRAGDTPVVFEGDHARMAAPICYEAILGPLCRSFEDVSLLINVTNDAWFGDTSASILHGMLAVIRSTELGIPLYRSAYTGISMVAEPHGVIHSQTPLFEEVSRVVGVRLATVPTLYGRFGDWFPMLCAGGLVLAGVASRRR
jgi:apolipoprotein N-acyltransferase